MTAVGDLTRNVGCGGGWLRVGASRGAAIGVVTPLMCALVGVVIVLTAEPEPLPAGTTTMSTQTPTQALAGLLLLGLYVAIVAHVGFVVGAAVGAATAGLAGALDVATARRLPAGLLAGVATVAAGWVVQAVAIGWIPTSRPLDADAERAWRLAFACPFVLGLLSLALAPLVRTPSKPNDGVTRRQPAFRDSRAGAFHGENR
jgi:MFS family permease